MHAVMLSFLPPVLRGVIAAMLLALNTLFWCTPLFALALLKLVLPFRGVRLALDPAIHGIATGWISGNSGWMRLTQPTRWDVAGTSDLAYAGWYLVQANHQSWVDIFALQHTLNRRIPFLKFFLKQQLIWVPVMGLAWWALEFPFMKRHSPAALRANPALRDEDRETTRRACAKFSLVPTSVMNFPEGTRFTLPKHAAQASPYQHLLKPKAGALALAIHAMGSQFQSLVDVTVVYPDGTPTFWELLCGRAGRVVLRSRTLPIPADFSTASYEQDKAFRSRFHRWLAQIWTDKDALIEEVMQESAARKGR